MTIADTLATLHHFIMRKGFSLHECSAIITGASSGLGAEFARQLAPQARSLLLAARRIDALEQVKAELLMLRPGLAVHCVECDVASDAGRAHLMERVDALGLTPNLLINNAGMGDYGSFASADETRLRAQIDVNVTALAMLCHAFVPRLQASAEVPAAILNVSSLAGNVPMPDLAVYGATKAFVTSFSEALRIELMERHIIVTTVCPGPTATNFGRTARRTGGADTNRSGQDLLRVPPSFVVGRALRALQQREACVFPGMGVSLVAPLFRIMPRALLRRVLERRYRKENS